jgi:hypothetical protein
MYNKDHGTTTMNRHVAFQHYAMLKQFNTRQTTTTTTITIHQTSKKWKKQPPLLISSTLKCHTKIQTLFKNCFLEDLILYIIKGNQPLSSIENVWLRRLVLHQCGQVTFPSRQQFNNKVISSMSKTMEHHIVPILVNAITITTTFDMWILEEVLIHLL